MRLDADGEEPSRVEDVRERRGDWRVQLLESGAGSRVGKEGESANGVCRGVRPSVLEAEAAVLASAPLEREKRRVF